MKIVVEIDDDKLRTKFDLYTKDKAKKLKKDIRKYIINFNPKMKWLSESINEFIDDYLN